MQRSLWAALGAVSIALSHGAAPPAPVPRADQVWLTGFTAPYRTATLSSAERGRIAEITVRQGDAVCASDELIVLDRGAHKARLAVAVIDAESTADIEIARVRMEHADEELERVKSLGNDATPKERLEAVANALVRRLEHLRAQEEQRRAIAQRDLQAHLFDAMVIRAPFDGYVSRRFKEPGESLDATDEVLTIVQLDPLFVRVYVPMDVAIRLVPGERVAVRPALSFLPERVAEVEDVARVADAASQMMAVRLIIENAAGDWPAGMRVEVGFPVRDEQTMPGLAAGTVYGPEYRPECGPKLQHE